MQLQQTLDDSLLERARVAAEAGEGNDANDRLLPCPRWPPARPTSSCCCCGPASCRPERDQPADRGARARGGLRPRSRRASARSGVGDEDFRVVAVPTATDGQRAGRRPVAGGPGAAARPARRGDAAVRAGRRARRRPGRLGGGPQRPASGAPADRVGRGHRPHRGPRPRCRSRATTRSPGWRRRSTRCSPRWPPPATGSGSWSPTPATSCARRSPRCAPTSTCSPRPTGRRRSAPAEARAELLDDVRAQIEELTTLIGDLVELARDEPLRHVVERRSTCAEVVDAAVARVRRRRAGLRLRRRRRALVGRSARPAPSSAPSPTCSTTPPSGARPAAGSRCGSPTASSPSTTRVPASPRTTAPQVFDRF